jgi:sugar phosphate permease
MNFTVLMPIMARDTLHVGAEGLGWMWAALGAGAVVGSVTVVRWSRAAVDGPLLFLAALLTGMGEMSLGAVRTLPLALAALLLVGWSTGMFFAGVNSAIQDRVADVFRGRVLSVYAMVFSGSGPLGGLFAAGLAVAGGAPLSLAVAGAVCLAAALLLWPVALRRLQPPGRAGAEAAAERAS